MLLQAVAEFPATMKSPRDARRFVALTLRRWGCPDLVDAAELLVSELVGNAVSHALSPAVLTMTFGDAWLHVEVADASSAHPTLRPVEPAKTDGRGLLIVDQLSERWGVDDAPSGGKSVWFDLAVAR